MSKDVDLSFLGRLCEQILEEVRGLRRDVSEVRELAVLTSGYARRLDRRITETRDDIELIVKSEIGGRLAHSETTLENTIAELAERIAALEASR